MVQRLEPDGIMAEDSVDDNDLEVLGAALDGVG